MLTRPSKVPPGRAGAADERAHRAGPSAAGPSAPAARAARQSIADVSRRLRLAAERLGPTYIKLGQILSSGEGIFPPELVDEFRKCRDQVPPEPFNVVRQVVEADLGRPLEEVFTRFHPEPLAAASIAQVHLATLRTGEEVVVKVQRPSVGQLVHQRPPGHGLDRPVPRRAASRWPPWPTRRRWWSCSPRRSPRSSTSGSRPRTCSTSPGPSPTSTSADYVDPPPAPHARHPARARDGAARGLQVRRRRRHAGRRRRHRAGRAHRDDRVHGGRHDPRHLPRRPPRREPLRDAPTAAPRCSTSASSAGSPSPAASRSSACSWAPPPTTSGASWRRSATSAPCPPDTDIDAVIHDLGPRPPGRSTRRSCPPTSSCKEIQNTIKALLGIGAKMPKELMLFVKNLVFLDGAIATLAPERRPPRRDRRGVDALRHRARRAPRRRARVRRVRVPARPRRREGRPRPRATTTARPTATCRSAGSSSAPGCQEAE